jgi:hypothetical protein
MTCLLGAVGVAAVIALGTAVLPNKVVKWHPGLASATAGYRGNCSLDTIEAEWLKLMKRQGLSATAGERNSPQSATDCT